MSGKRLFSILIIAILFSLNISVTYGLDDGFGGVRKIEGKHFIVHYAVQIEVSYLVQQLNIRSSDKLLVGKLQSESSSLEVELADMLDTLFMQVSDILDMHLYSFQGKIKICEDYNQLNRVYNNLFNKDLKGMRSFYVYELNTIYISGEDFKPEIIGHEIAHAIISYYFVVQPPIKIQEILAGYVEYQLRKSK